MQQTVAAAFKHNDGGLHCRRREHDTGSVDTIVQVEGIGMQEAALARLGEIGESASLRHAVQLLTPAHVLAKSAGRCGACPVALLY